MNYKLSTKNSEGKWWSYGTFKANQYGKLQASFKLSALKDLVGLAESQGKEWVNLAAFEADKPKEETAQDYAKNSGATYVDDGNQLEDIIPF
jgi:hypothetical protein